MLEVLFVLAVAAAVRGLVQQTRRDLARWRSKPPPAPGRGLSGVLRRVTAGGTGYWAHQAAHGFPTGRAGLHDGWMRAVEAHHQARRQIEQGRAERAEGKAELQPELDDLRQRRRAALARLEEQQAEQDRAAHEAWMEQNRQALARDQDRIRAEAERERVRWQARRAADAERELDRLRAERERAENGRAGQEFTCRCCGDEDTGTGPLCAACTAAGCRPQRARDGEVAYWNCERDPDHEAQYDPFLRADPDDQCDDCGAPLTDEPGHLCIRCQNDNTGNAGPAPQTPGGTNTGDEPVSETSYAGVKARMSAAEAGAERRQAEAKSSEGACEERVQEADSAKSWAMTTAEQMQALKVDAETLSAMADHMDALSAAKEAEDAMLEAVQQAKKAWGLVVESSGKVSAQLDASGHGGVQEARDNAAGGGAEKEFYGEGAA